VRQPCSDSGAGKEQTVLLCIPPHGYDRFIQQELFACEATNQMTMTDSHPRLDIDPSEEAGVVEDVVEEPNIGHIASKVEQHDKQLNEHATQLSRFAAAPPTTVSEKNTSEKTQEKTTTELWEIY
jgi:hypothetical protein